MPRCAVQSDPSTLHLVFCVHLNLPYCVASVQSRSEADGMLAKWASDGGVLLLSYDRYRSLVLAPAPTDAGVGASVRGSVGADGRVERMAAVAVARRKKILGALCDPGPDLVRVRPPRPIGCFAGRTGRAESTPAGLSARSGHLVRRACVCVCTRVSS